MLAKRVLSAAVLLPVGLAFIIWGGWPFALLVAGGMSLAAQEYVRLLQAGGLRPAGFLVVGGSALLVLARAWDGFAGGPAVGVPALSASALSLLILAAMTVHLIEFERGCPHSGTDFGVTLGGLLYLGWIGAYLALLRALPEGMWWLLTVLPAVWIADSAAYLVGKRWGRHKLSRRLSPNKSWEGYLGGVAAAAVGGALLPLAFAPFTGPASALTPARGALLGLAVSALSLLGDLGESMFKRQVGAKDSGDLLPGHGGVFDRIDSWLWAGAIGYYLISLFLL